MVECELFFLSLFHAKQFSFNRYMVECECWKCNKSHNHEWVLIDTWWNVNTGESNVLTMRKCVLIDTWWNVNHIKMNLCTIRILCFNRYMVECELQCAEKPDFIITF